MNAAKLTEAVRWQQFTALHGNLVSSY